MSNSSLKACLLMAPFSVRSERQFCERLEYDLLFKWFLDLNIMDHSFAHSVFSKNKQRLLDADVAREFLLQIVEQAKEHRLVLEEHFSVDEIRPRRTGDVAVGEEFPAQRRDPPSAGGGRNPEVDFHEERRSNTTHRSTTDPEAAWPRRAKGRKRGCASAPMC